MNYPRKQVLRSLYPRDYTISKVKVRTLYTIDVTGILGYGWICNIFGNTIATPYSVSPGAVTTTVEINGPQGWSKLIYPFWGKAFVSASSCKVRWAQVTNASGSTQAGLWKLILVPQRVTQAINTTEYEYLYAQPYAKRAFTWNFNSRNVATIKHYATTKKIFGMSSNKLYLDDTFQSNTSATGFSATSARPWYWCFHASTINDSAAQNTQICEVTVVYYFRAWDRKDQTAD